MSTQQKCSHLRLSGMPAIESFKIDGLAAATFTPYKADGSVDYAGVDAHCADLAAHGVRFAFSESISCAW